MRLGWHIPLPGPFSLGGTVWRSKSRRRGYHGTLPGWKCPHNHSRMDLAVACANREAARRAPAEARRAREQADERRTAGVIGTALSSLEQLFDGKTPPPGDLPGIGTALGDMGEMISDNLTGASQRTARRRLGRLRKQLSDAQATTPAPDAQATAPDAQPADSPRQARRRTNARTLAIGGALLTLGLIFVTHGIILIPAVIAGAVVAIRRGRVRAVPGLGIAAGLIAVIITGAVLTSGTPAPASAAPASPQPSHSAPASPAPSRSVPASHAPASPAPSRSAPASHAPASHAPASQAPASQAPASQAPASQAPASQAPAPAPAPASAAPASVYRAGEYCSAHGATAVDAHGSPLTCSFNNGWRWEH